MSESEVENIESITKDVLDRARNLKMISRVGIGLDSVDLATTRDRGIEELQR